MLLQIIHHSSDLAPKNHKVTFDGSNRLIYVNYGVTDIHIKEDIYSDWKEWYLLRDNAKYPISMRTVGGDPIGVGAYTGDTYFLMNGWKLVVDITKVKITGVLFSDDYLSAYYDNQIKLQYPAQVSALVNTIMTKENIITGDLSSIDLTKLDVHVSSRMASDDPNMAAIKFKTDTINWQTVTDLHEEAFGKWIIDTSIIPHKLIFYRPDGVTELKRFSLLQDGDGSYLERTPI